MVVTQNIEANFTKRQIGIKNKALSRNTEKLASGYRINRAADDASGLAISEGMRGQVRGLNRSALNTDEGTSFCQIADGAMQEIENIVHRMRELAVQAADDVNTPQDRQMIQYEIEQLVTEVDHITNYTEYNTLKVFSDNALDINGKDYGLSKVLGKNNVYQGQYMDSPVSFTNGGWNNTGTPATIVRYGVSVNGGANQNIYNVVSYMQQEYGVTIQNTSAGNVNAMTLYSADGKSEISLQYNQIKPDGTRLLNTITVNTYDSVLPNPAANLTETRKLTGSCSAMGSTGLGGTQFYGSWVDFDGLGTTYRLSDLEGLGFNTGCTHCSGQKRYNVEFTLQPCNTTNSSGVNYTFTTNKTTSNVFNTLKVNIAGCTSGADIVGRIMSAANSESAFTNHYIQFAYHNSDPSKLYMYDDEAGSRTSMFEPAVRTEGGLQIETGKRLNIQVGSNSDQFVTIDVPYLNASMLGISMVNLTKRESAENAISVCDGAIDILNQERSRMGSMVVRLSHAYDNVKNAGENMQSSESLVRDLDMADEMVKHSANNIILQAAQSMLSQANSSKDGVMALFRE